MTRMDNSLSTWRVLTRRRACMTPVVLNRGLMNDQSQTHANVPPILRVAAGEDQYGEYRGLGVSYIAFKVCPPDSNGILVLENTFHAKGGPARHLHYDQDEWFYAV